MCLTTREKNLLDESLATITRGILHKVYEIIKNLFNQPQTVSYTVGHNWVFQQFSDPQTHINIGCETIKKSSFNFWNRSVLENVIEYCQEERLNIQREFTRSLLMAIISVWTRWTCQVTRDALYSMHILPCMYNIDFITPKINKNCHFSC